MTIDSLKKRYLYKLFSTAIGIPVAFFIQYFALRSLGPASYGSFNYLTDFFLKIFNFADSSSTFFLSKKMAESKDSFKPLCSYLVYALLVVSVLLIILSAFTKFNILSLVLPGQESKYVFLALSWAIFWWLNKILTFTVDGKGLTKKGEVLNSFIKFLSITILSYLYFGNYLTLTTFFVFQTLILILNCVGTLFVLKLTTFKISTKDLKSFSKDAWSYSSPLLILNIVLLFSELIDRWFLQIFSGNTEQGHFGLAFQISTFYILFTNAFAPLLFREFSVWHSTNSIDAIKVATQKYLPLFYTLTATFSIFLSTNSKEIAFIIGGKQYENANGAILLMAILPLYQSYGQICGGSILMATNQTKKIKKVTIFTSIMTLPLSLFFIMPKTLWGLELGAAGLALKMLIFQILTVSCFLYYVCAYLKLSFKKQIKHQITIIALFILIAYVSKKVVLLLNLNLLAQFLLHFFIYLSILYLLTSKFEFIWGVNINRMLINRFKRKRN